MEQKMITIPFDVELAKKIQAGEHPGKIVTRDGRDVRIVCWDRKTSMKYRLVGLIDNGEYEHIARYSELGESLSFHKLEDLMLQVPEWMQYKDGDILSCEVDNGGGDYCKWFSVLDGNIGFMLGNTYFSSYVSYDHDTPCKTEELTYDDSCDNIGSIRLATKEEKQRFIERLKREGTSKAKDILKRFFGIEEKKEYKFEPFQKVLVRMHDGAAWEASLFSHLIDNSKEPFMTVGGMGYEQCIPYNDQTKHLLGTTDNWEEE